MSESVKERAVQLKGAVDGLSQQVADSFDLETTRDYLLKITAELSELIGNIEEGSVKILDHTEELFKYSNRLSADERERISFHTNNLCEAACFHELSCQRVGKIIDLLNDFFEVVSKVENNKDANMTTLLTDLNHKNSQRLNNGPQLSADMLSQDAIDDLF